MTIERRTHLDRLRLLQEKEEDVAKYVEKDNTVYIGPYFQYPIDLDRIKTPLNLLGWVEHISSKTWVSKRLIHNFVVTVCKVKKWKIYGI